MDLPDLELPDPSISYDGEETTKGWKGVNGSGEIEKYVWKAGTTKDERDERKRKEGVADSHRDG